jgi:hypothetical protein
MIHDFFDSYATALENGIIKQIVNHFHFPCTISSGDFINSFGDPSRLEGILAQSLRFFKQLGIVHIKAEVRSSQYWAEHVINAKVNWKYYDGINLHVYNYDYQYVLKADKNDRWKIILAISVNEKERVEELMKKIKS